MTPPVCKVLVVDDDETNRLVIRRLIEGLGDIEVLAADSGPQALEMAARHDLAMVLLDVMMPGMDGFETADHLRAGCCGHPPPIVFVTALDPKEQDALEGYARGAVDYLFKPVDPRLLRAKVRIFAELHRQRLALAETLEHLQASRRALDRAQDVARMGSFTLDAAGRVLAWSDGMNRVLGRPAEAPPPGPGALPALAGPEDRQALADALEQALHGRHRRLEFRRRDAAGDERVLLLRLEPEPAPGDGAPQAVGTCQDITARKAMELQLAASQRLDAIGHLAGGLAHEINTPIQYVGGNIDFIGRALGRLAGLAADLDALGPEGTALAARHGLADAVREIPPALGDIRDGLSRVSGIVEALRKLIPGRQGTILPTDVNAMLQDLATVTRAEWRAVAEMRVEPDPGLPPVPCDRGGVSQALLNMVLNAIQAVAERQARDGRMGVLRLRSRREGGMAVLEVADDGVGVPEAIRGKIFNPFFTTREVGRGSGQGLALAQTVAHNHGGSITFTPAPEGGAVFTLRLPLRSASGEPS
ncbi:MAG: response regulator [Desulfovibrionaceae bacterium]